jgi:fructokinase
VLETAPTALAVYDVNLRQEWYSRAIIEHSLRAATVVKLNESEVQTIGPLLGIPIEPLSFASNIRERYGVMLVCVTRGEQGCALFAADASAEHGGVAITVADAVGAGDAFTAALIFSLVEKWTLATSAAFANHIGALVAARPGAMPELGSEYASLVQRARTGHLSE